MKLNHSPSGHIKNISPPDGSRRNTLITRDTIMEPVDEISIQDNQKFPERGLNLSISPQKLKENVQKGCCGAVQESSALSFSNEEIIDGLKSGNPETAGKAVFYVLNTGRDDDRVLGQVFDTIENENDDLMNKMENMAINEELSLSKSPGFRKKYMDYLDKFLDKQANADKLKSQPHLSFFMAYSLLETSTDPRLLNILQKLELI